MRSGSLSMSTRRAFFVMVMMALLCGASGMRAQQAAAPPAAQAADQLKFSTVDRADIWQVKPDKAAGFESAWAAIKTKLSASDKPDFKELGDSIKIFKVNTAPERLPDRRRHLRVPAHPPSKTLSYDPGKILYAPGHVGARGGRCVVQEDRGRLGDLQRAAPRRRSGRRDGTCMRHAGRLARAGRPVFFDAFMEAGRRGDGERGRCSRRDWHARA